MAQGYAAQTLLIPTTEDVSDVFDKVNKNLEAAVRKNIALKDYEDQKKSDEERDKILSGSNFGIYNNYNKGGDIGDGTPKPKQGNTGFANDILQGNEAGKKIIEQRIDQTKKEVAPLYDAEAAKLQIDNDLDLSMSQLALQTLTNELGNSILNYVGRQGFNANNMTKWVGDIANVKFLPQWLQTSMKGTGVLLKGVAPGISIYNAGKAYANDDIVGVYKHGIQAAGWGASALTTSGAFAGSYLGPASTYLGAAGLGAGLGILAADAMDYIIKSGALDIENKQTLAMAHEFSNQFTGAYVQDYIKRQLDNIDPNIKNQLKESIIKEAQNSKELSEAIQKDGIENVLNNNLSMMITQDPEHINAIKTELMGTDKTPGYLQGVVKDISEMNNQGSSRGYYGMLWMTDIDKSARRKEMQTYLDMVPVENNPLMEAYSNSKQEYIDYMKAEYRDPETEQKLRTNYQLAERKAYFKRVADAKKETARIVNDDRFSLAQKKQAILNTVQMNWLSSSAGDVDVKDINDYGYGTNWEGIKNLFK